MNALIEKEIRVSNLSILDNLAQKIACKLKGSETLELLSDLGGGKTALTRCLVKHLKSLDAVSSPSFTIENIYRCHKFNIHHFDFYRLESPGVCAFELSEALANPNALVIIEWSQIVKELLPLNRLIIEIKLNPSPQNPQERLFVFKAPLGLKYLVEDL